MDEAHTAPDTPAANDLPVLVVDEGGKLIAWTAEAENAFAASANMQLSELALPPACAASLGEAVAAASASGQSRSIRLELPPGELIGGTVTAIVTPISTSLVKSAAAIVMLPGSLAATVDAQGLAGPSPDQLVAEVAHELSRPLASVLAHSELVLQDPDLPEPVRTRAQMVVHHAALCQAAVRRFLQAGRPRPESIQAVDLAEVVRQALQSLDRAVRESGAEVSLDLDPELAPVAGNPADLQAVVRNLLENALDAAGRSTQAGRVKVIGRHTAGRVTLAVTDNGPGISPSVSDRIFEPFITTKEAGLGTGLGLSICRRIVHEHGGQVTVRSRLGQGATFTVELPVGDLPADELEPPREHAAEAGATAEPGTGRALVVEDDVSMRKLLKAYLEGLGYQTVEAEDGRKALERCRSDSFDVIVCDVKMPGMSGAEFFRSLADASPDQATRVIFSSGVLSVDDDNAFLKTLPNPRLHKPFRLSALREAIDSATRASRQA
jgi:signal transduction histidine kinase/ActR/RegA family two-component response regulator